MGRWIYGQMDGWSAGWMDRWIDGQDRWIDGQDRQTDRQKDNPTGRQADIQISGRQSMVEGKTVSQFDTHLDSQTDIQIERETDKKTDGEMDRQTDQASSTFQRPYDNTYKDFT